MVDCTAMTSLYSKPMISLEVEFFYQSRCIMEYLSECWTCTLQGRPSALTAAWAATLWLLRKKKTYLRLYLPL
jgi:hypothetical protein